MQAKHLLVLFSCLTALAQPIGPGPIVPYTDYTFKFYTNLTAETATKYVGIRVDTIAELQAESRPLTALWVSDTNRGGLFTYTGSALTHDGGVVFTATGRGSGFWVRMKPDGGPYTTSDRVNVAWFGLDPGEDYGTAVATITGTYGYKKLQFNAGTYYSTLGYRMSLATATSHGLDWKGVGDATVFSPATNNYGIYFDFKALVTSNTLPVWKLADLKFTSTNAAIPNHPFGVMAGDMSAATAASFNWNGIEIDGVSTENGIPLMTFYTAETSWSTNRMLDHLLIRNYKHMGASTNDGYSAVAVYNLPITINKLAFKSAVIENSRFERSGVAFIGAVESGTAGVPVGFALGNIRFSNNYVDGWFNNTLTNMDYSLQLVGREVLIENNVFRRFWPGMINSHVHNVIYNNNVPRAIYRNNVFEDAGDSAIYTKGWGYPFPGLNATSERENDYGVRIVGNSFRSVATNYYGYYDMVRIQSSGALFAENVLDWVSAAHGVISDESVGPLTIRDNVVVNFNGAKWYTSSPHVFYTGNNSSSAGYALEYTLQNNRFLGVTNVTYAVVQTLGGTYTHTTNATLTVEGNFFADSVSGMYFDHNNATKTNRYASSIIRNNKAIRIPDPEAGSGSPILSWIVHTTPCDYLEATGNTADWTTGDGYPNVTVSFSNADRWLVKNNYNLNTFSGVKSWPYSPIDIMTTATPEASKYSPIGGIANNTTGGGIYYKTSGTAGFNTTWTPFLHGILKNTVHIAQTPGADQANVYVADSASGGAGTTTLLFKDEVGTLNELRMTRNTKTLTDATATKVFWMPLTADSFIGGQVLYTIYGRGTNGVGTNQVATGVLKYSGVTQGSTEVVSLTGDVTESGVTVSSSPAGSVLTWTWTADFTTNEVADFKLNADTDLAGALTFRVDYTVIDNTAKKVNPQ